LRSVALKKLETPKKEGGWVWDCKVLLAEEEGSAKNCEGVEPEKHRASSSRLRGTGNLLFLQDEKTELLDGVGKSRGHPKVRGEGDNVRGKPTEDNDNQSISCKKNRTSVEWRGIRESPGGPETIQNPVE